MTRGDPVGVCPEGSIRIDSRADWNDTGLDVEAGRTYRYSAEGVWCDWHILTDADGFERWYMAPLRFGRRVPRERWFRLIGMIGRDVAVVMGKSGEFTAPSSGRLECFANDWMSARGNNKGAVCLRISIV